VDLRGYAGSLYQEGFFIIS